MLSDSQASTPTAEVHGVHKQYVGDDFIIGGAGHGLVTRLVLGSLPDARFADVPALEHHIRRFLDEEVTPEVQAKASFILATASSIRVLIPGFRSFVDMGSPVSAIGSGEAFVTMALKRDAKLGINRKPPTLADALILSEMLSDASNESLTVNDKLSCGILTNGRGYVLGDREVVPRYATEGVRNHWREVSRRWEEISAIARFVRGEQVTAQAVFSRALMLGKAPPFERIESSAQGIAGGRALLSQRLNEYFAWYDGTVRPAS